GLNDRFPDCLVPRVTAPISSHPSLEPFPLSTEWEGFFYLPKAQEKHRPSQPVSIFLAPRATITMMDYRDCALGRAVVYGKGLL
ncbi:MAG: hypothetical protein SV201_15490, partial [Pseudomonadota bacterium]|nr:hypothetical protein [Pseudomonadota bacterium]